MTTMRLNDAQKHKLLDLMVENYPILSDKSMVDINFTRFKKEKWIEISEILNKLGPEKTMVQWQKCWSDMKRKVRVKLEYINFEKSKGITLHSKILQPDEEKIREICNMKYLSTGQEILVPYEIDSEDQFNGYYIQYVSNDANVNITNPDEYGRETECQLPQEILCDTIQEEQNYEQNIIDSVSITSSPPPPPEQNTEIGIRQEEQEEQEDEQNLNARKRKRIRKYKNILANSLKSDKKIISLLEKSVELQIENNKLLKQIEKSIRDGNENKNSSNN